jgi:hypothetical protein
MTMLRLRQKEVHGCCVQVDSTVVAFHSCVVDFHPEPAGKMQNAVVKCLQLHYVALYEAYAVWVSDVSFSPSVVWNPYRIASSEKVL